MTKKKKEKLWLRCVNLFPNPSNAEIATFFESVKIGDLGLDSLDGNIGILHYELDKFPVAYPSIQAFQKWHLSFYSIFDYWLKHKDFTDAQVEWIDKQVLDFTLKFRKTPLPEHPFFLALMQETHLINKFIVTQFAEFLSNPENKVRQCEASDCNNYFIPVPQGKEQRYCCLRCQKRAYKREYRKRQKEKI